MPSVQYMNNSAPFWDWVASLEQDRMSHPWFSQWNWNENSEDKNERGGDERGGRPPFSPWGRGFSGFAGRAFPHRDPPTHNPHNHHHNERDEEKGNGGDHRGDKKANEKDMEGADDNSESPSGSSSETEGRCRRRGGRCGSHRGRHGCGGSRSFGRPGLHHGLPHGNPGRYGHHHGQWGGFGPWERGGFGPVFNPFAFASSFLGPTSDNKDENSDFMPEADIFDTPTAFVVHVSLPGAKKEDVGVNWDVEKSEISIAGVIYRPGDEEFLKTLTIDERKVGPFGRKIRLGTRVNPATIDIDGISAKLEDGVLTVEVPKLGDNGFVEVRKVDIE